MDSSIQNDIDMLSRRGKCNEITHPSGESNFSNEVRKLICTKAERDI